MISQLMGLDREIQGVRPAEFALVGEIAVILDGGRDLDGLDAALLCLRSYLEADACEMFVATPDGQEMVLVSHQGADPTAFSQRERFRSGEGFPGIVLSTGAVVSTLHLPSESEFLRSRVKGLGYESVVCVPVHCGTEVGGCISLAWKRAVPRSLKPHRVALLASLPLGSAVEVARARVRELVEKSASGESEGTLEDRFLRITSADDVRVVVFGAGSQSVRKVQREAAEARWDSDGCAALRSGRPQVLGARSGWPQACILSQCVCRARYCVPLKRGDEIWGVATVAFERHAPQPLTRRLPAALWLADAVIPAGQPRQQELEAGAPEVAGHRARLDIRCLGGFEVRVSGRLLRPSDFGRSKAYELLAHLVWAFGKPLTADELAGALWPRTDPVLLRNRFHVTLSALRRVVEPESGKGRRWTHIRSDQGRYSLDSHSPVYVDLWHLDALLRQVDHPGFLDRNPIPGASPADRAIRLYAGDPFQGAFDDDWAEIAARQWRLRFARAFPSLRGSTPEAGSLASGNTAEPQLRR